MSDDFEKTWLAKLSSNLDRVVGLEIRGKIMAGSEGLSDGSERNAIIAWSKQAMDHLNALVDEEERREIMTGCACQYPKAELQDMRTKYKETGDISIVHGMLHERFVSFLRDSLRLDDDIIDDVVTRGMGLAGKLEGNTIVATKIPKSGYLRGYFAEKDPVKKRAIYCHCPRIRDALKTNADISSTYCYCGAGYYKGIWEEILQRPVKVELLESVLKGDDACKVAIDPRS
jgi:hypothetical protein